MPIFCLEMEKNRRFIMTLIDWFYSLDFGRVDLIVSCDIKDVGFKSRYPLFFFLSGFVLSDSIIHAIIPLSMLHHNVSEIPLHKRQNWCCSWFVGKINQNSQLASMERILRQCLSFFYLIPSNIIIPLSMLHQNDLEFHY